jgi:hypothetical protein
MPKIKITTDRLPQPDRRLGAVLDVPAEKAISLIAQGFAERAEDDEDLVVDRPRRGRPRKAATSHE